MTIAPSSSGFGSGPMTVSLIGSARMMAPLRGEEATNPSRDMDIARPVDAAPFGTTGGASKALVAERAKVSPAETGKDVAFAR